MLTEENVLTQEDSFFETPEIQVPRTPPDAHRAKITGVTLARLNNDKQTAVIEIGVVSQDVPTLEDKLSIFVPKGYEEGVSQGSRFDPTSLPEEEGNKQQSSYRYGFSNSDKTATMQLLVTNADSVARRAGRNPIELELKRNPATLEEYVENIGKMLTGLDVIMIRREKGGDDAAFAHRLVVKDILAADEYERNPKRFKRYVLAWDGQ